MNSETFLEKKKKKKKKKVKKNTQIQITFFPGHSLRKVPANCTKLCDTIFSITFFLISLYKIPD